MNWNSCMEFRIFWYTNNNWDNKTFITTNFLREWICGRLKCVCTKIHTNILRVTPRVTTNILWFLIVRNYCSCFCSKTLNYWTHCSSGFPPAFAVKKVVSLPPRSSSNAVSLRKNLSHFFHMFDLCMDCLLSSWKLSNKCIHIFSRLLL